MTVKVTVTMAVEMAVEMAVRVTVKVAMAALVLTWCSGVRVMLCCRCCVLEGSAMSLRYRHKDDSLRNSGIYHSAHSIYFITNLQGRQP